MLPPPKINREYYLGMWGPLGSQARRRDTIPVINGHCGTLSSQESIGSVGRNRNARHKARHFVFRRTERIGRRNTPKRGSKTVCDWKLVQRALAISPYRASHRALRIHIERIERMACRHEQAVLVHAAEAQIGATFGKRDPADLLALRTVDGDAVEFFAGAGAAPDV